MINSGRMGVIKPTPTITINIYLLIHKVLDRRQTCEHKDTLLRIYAKASKCPFVMVKKPTLILSRNSYRYDVFLSGIGLVDHWLEVTLSILLL